MAYPIKVDYSDYGYSQNKPFPCKGAVVHETAAPGWTDERLQDYFDSGSNGRHVCSHLGVDWDSITQMVPFTKRAYHAGTHGNDFIGVELCRPKTHDPAKFIEVWKRGVWVFAHLFVDCIIPVQYHNFKVTKENLMSHAEVSAKWPKDTNHVDPVAYFKEYGYTVDDFRKAVQMEIDALRAAAQVAFAEEELIDNAVKVNILTNGAYWLNVLRGKITPVPTYIMYLLNNATGNKSMDIGECVAAAVRYGVISDTGYWTKAIKGEIVPKPEFIAKILERGAALKGVRS